MVACHRCGRRAQAGARFCGACGALLGSARPGARKTVTVLFADAPAVAAAEDVEAAVRAASALHERVRQVLTEHGGTVERHAGDAVMAVFGVPTARDDDARRAAAAGLAAVRAVRALPGEPALSVGVNTGEVLTGDGGQGEELAVGDPVVVGARLQQHARPGEVLLGPATVALLGPGARLGPARDLLLRGRSEPLPAVPLEALEVVAAAPSRGPFVGREPELQLLHGVLDRALSPSGVVQLVTVLGEPGTGKTRLVQQVLSEREEDLVVLRGTCRGYGDRSTWSALVEVLHDVTGVARGEGASVVLAQLVVQRPELRGSLPVLASLLGDGGTPIGTTELSSALARAVAVVAETAPVVVVLEDLHLATGPLLDLVPELVRRLEGSRVVLLTTARPELLEHRAGWGRGLRHTVGLTLRPLDPSSARELAEHLVPGDPAGVQALLGTADGNPLFLEQLARDRLESHGSAVPSVAAVLAARLDRLPAPAREVLERAAVVGPWGSVADLRPLCEADVDSELAVLARRDLLVVTDGRWSFSSELVREAAAAGLTRAERAGLHLARGTVLADAGQDGAAGFHLEQASGLLQGPEPARSAELARRAADLLAAAGRSALSGDLVAAEDLLARAAALRGPDDPQRLALLPDLALAKQLSGDLGGAESVLEEAVSRSAALGLAQPAARARLARAGLLRSTDPERAYVNLPDLLADVLPVLEAGQDHRGLALAWQLQAAALQYQVQWAAMEQPLAAALHHARAAGDRRLVELAQELLVSSALQGPTHLDAARVRLEQLLAEPGASPAHRAFVRARYAVARGLQGEPDTARAELAEVRRALRDLGRELPAVAAVALSAPVELWAGEPERAAAELTEACEAMTAMGHLAWTSSLASLLAEAEWRCGRPQRAAAAVELTRSCAGVGDVVSQVRWRSVQARLLAGEGRAQEALALAAGALARVGATDEVLAQAAARVAAAEVHELLGDGPQAQRLLREAHDLAVAKGAELAVRRLAGRLLVVPDQPPTGVIAHRVSDLAPG